MYTVIMIDDYHVTKAVDIEDNKTAWGLFETMAEMYMKSEKRKGDHAEVVLWEDFDSTRRVRIARYQQASTKV